MEEAIKYFQKFGLTQYESAALAALLSKHDATAEDISEIAGIPYTKIYAVLVNLERQGFLKTTLERPKKYCPLSPESIVNSLIQRHQKEIDYLKEKSQEGLGVIQELYDNGEKYAENGPIVYLPTQEAVWDGACNYLITSNESVNIISNKQTWNFAFVGQRSKQLIKAHLGFFERGGKAKHLISSSWDVSPLLPKIDLAVLKFLSHPNLTARFISDFKSHPDIIISDEKEVGMAFMDPNTQEVATGIILKDKRAVDAYVDYFNMLWDTSKSMPNFVIDKVKQALQNRGIKL